MMDIRKIKKALKDGKGILILDEHLNCCDCFANYDGRCLPLQTSCDEKAYRELGVLDDCPIIRRKHD